MNHKYRTWIFYAVLVFGLVAASFLFGSLREGTRTVRAQDVLAPGAPDAYTTCTTIENVAVYESRMHVKCSPGVGLIKYFAYSTDSAHSSTANRMLAVANSAYAVGDKLGIWYDSNSSNNPPGCQVNDCRLMQGLVWVP
jgi:hypothetical protein